jgi:hypothetical protein
VFDGLELGLLDESSFSGAADWVGDHAGDGEIDDSLLAAGEAAGSIFESAVEVLEGAVDSIIECSESIAECAGEGFDGAGHLFESAGDGINDLIG